MPSHSPSFRALRTVLLASAAIMAVAPAAIAGPYGGGLIELLMTGRDPTQSGAPQRYAPAPQRYAPALAAPRRAALGTVYNIPDEPDAMLAPQPDPVYAPPQARQASLAPRPVDGDIDPIYRKQVVDYSGREGPGTVVIDSPNKFLYLVQGDGKALRYGIGVGRPGFTWAGVKSITRKAEWPGWTPPPEMLKRRPDLPRHMDGGPGNPLGARAMYLGSTLYRIHGTNEPNTIGTNVSSGCIRMLNEDVTDLYGRVQVGTRVIVM